MMYYIKNKKRGFTLVELLMTILILGIVAGLTAFGIIKIINNSKNKSSGISLSNIQETAKTYSLEANDNSWHSLTDNDYNYYCSNLEEEAQKKCDNFKNNYKYFCVTVGELINKGLLKDEAVKKLGVDKSTYILVKKNKVTNDIVNDKFNTVEELNDSVNLGQYNLCTGEWKNESIIKKPNIKDTASTTDSIKINYEDGKIDENIDDSYIDKYICKYGTTSNTLDKEVEGINNSCHIPNLTNNTNYYIRVCLTTNRGNSTCSDTKEVSTKDLKVPTIVKDKVVTAKITYDDSNITSPSHYFKSDISASSNTKLSTCILTDNKYTCSGETTEVNANTWYRVSSTEVILDYTGYNGDIKINATIRDGSNNEKTNEKTINIKSVFTVTYNSNGGSGAPANQTKIYGKNLTLSSTKPTRTGYTFLGWSTSSTATTATYSAGGTYSDNASVTLYAVWKTNAVTYTATFYKGLADSINGQVNDLTLSCTTTTGSTCTITAPNIIRSGYNVLGWNESNSSKTASFKAGSTVTLDANKSYYPITYKSLKATFEPNGATVSYSSKSCTIYNDETSCSITSPTITGSSNTPIVVGFNTSSSATSSILNTNTSKTISTNVTYYAITKQDLSVKFISQGSTVTFDDSGTTTITRTCTIYNNANKCSTQTTTPQFKKTTVCNANADASKPSTVNCYFSTDEKDLEYTASSDLWKNASFSLSVNNNGKVYYAILISNINGNRYRCNVDESHTYYISKCNITYCQYTRHNGSSEIGIVHRPSLRVESCSSTSGTCPSTYNVVLDTNGGLWKSGTTTNTDVDRTFQNISGNFYFANYDIEVYKAGYNFVGWRSVKNDSVYHSYVDSCDIYGYDYNGIPYVLLSAYYEKA